MSVRRVFLVGEGPNELGGWAKEPQYVDPDEVGVLQALLEGVAPGAFEVVAARPWSAGGRSFRRGGATTAEARRVAAWFLDAQEKHCDLLVYVRDEDGDSTRAESHAQGRAKGAADHPTVDVVGGLAIQAIEGWLLALRGEPKSERVKARAGKKRVQDAGLTCTADMVECVRGADLDRLPPDAHSLRAWLDQARAVFTPQQPPSQR